MAIKRLVQQGFVEKLDSDLVRMTHAGKLPLQVSSQLLDNCLAPGSSVYLRSVYLQSPIQRVIVKFASKSYQAAGNMSLVAVAPQTS